MTSLESGKGPAAYQNWKAALKGAPSGTAFEVALYSDVEITGHIVAEAPTPYSFLNALHFRPPGVLGHRATIRLAIHREPDADELPAMDQTDTRQYHGGSILDELGALTALLMGARVRSGGLVRRFDEGGDPRGTPQADDAVPALPNRRRFGALIARALEPKNLNDRLLPVFLSYPRLSPADAVALVRAARLYQDALWIAEAEPELAWLFLVSALEAPATAHHTATMDPVETLKRSNPGLAHLLEQTGDPSLFQAAAAALLPLFRATGRFIDFAVRFQPSPPPNRPHENVRFSWESGSMKRALSKIYEHRSRALHDGTPFPRPMCELAPIPAEIPVAHASSIHGGTWVREDMPMLLHTFEYLVQGALLNWWRSLVPDAEHPSAV